VASPSNPFPHAVAYVNDEMFMTQYAGREALLDAMWEKSKGGLTPNECYHWLMRQARDLVVGTAMPPRFIINYLSRRREKEGYGLASSEKSTKDVLEKLEKVRREEGWYQSAAVTGDEKLGSLFWASKYQLGRWQMLNDCSIFDTTYNTSIEKMKLTCSLPSTSTGARRFWRKR